MTTQLDLMEQALAAHERGHRAALIAWLRGELVKLYVARRIAGGDRAAVTADDARVLLARSGRDPGGNRNWIGAVFKGAGWEPIEDRWHFSETAGSHANRLRCWRWVG